MMTEIDMYNICEKRLNLLPPRHRTQAVCEVAVTQKPEAIEHVPVEVMTEKMIVTALLFYDYEFIAKIPVEKITVKVALAALATGGSTAHRLLNKTRPGIVFELLGHDYSRHIDCSYK
jgi:hypothetical protein